MAESIQIAIQVYLMGFVISMFIAALIKGMLIIIRRFSSEKKTENK
ncbi:MAG TPA: hypothetical protein VM577_02840 [Anaerovoracaceae bacterium]|nr:hypothetical protein [Anaerovoracaceae bacterium]